MERMRQRGEDAQDRHRPVAPGDDDGRSLERTRQQARSILSAGAEAIERALSQDSDTFLRQSQQHGGQ